MFNAIRSAVDRFRRWRVRRQRYSIVAPWHLSNVLTDSSFNFFGTYHEAVAELRHRIPGANIVHVDFDDGLEGNSIGRVIFYNVPPK